jgi:hypothetical protein
MSRRSTLMLMGVFVGTAAFAEPEPTMTDCWDAVAAVQARVGKRPADDPVRLEVEHLLRAALGEGGSGEIDECLEYAEQAAAHLSNAPAPKD